MAGLKLKATSSGGEAFEIPEAGSHAAVLVAVIDCGTHTRQFPGGPAKDQRELYFAWELPEERMAGTDRPHVISRVYTFSFHEKAGMRAMVEGWAGRKYKDDEEFDPLALLGKPCQVNVVHKTTNSGKTVANLAGVTKLMKGMAAPTARYTPISYILDPGGESPPSDNWLPFLYDGATMVHVSDYCRTSKEWLAAQGAKGAGGNGSSGNGSAVGRSAPPADMSDEAPF